jgi:hypothetical protein
LRLGLLLAASTAAGLGARAVAGVGFGVGHWNVSEFDEIDSRRNEPGVKTDCRV